MERKYILTYKDFIEKINEGLIKTHKIDKSIQIINKFLKTYNLIPRISADKRTSDFSVEVDIDHNFKYNFYNILSELKTLTMNLGYFPALVILKKKKNFLDKLFKKKDKITKYIDDSFKDVNFNEFEIISIFYESKYDKVVKNIPDKLYHVFNLNIKDKIIKNGLIPKSKNKNSFHPERIYFAYTLNDALQLKYKFEQVYKQPSGILEYFNINSKFVFYEDPRGGFDKEKNIRSIYTYNNISPKDIKFISDSDITNFYKSLGEHLY